MDSSLFGQSMESSDEQFMEIDERGRYKRMRCAGIATTSLLLAIFLTVYIAGLGYFAAEAVAGSDVDVSSSRCVDCGRPGPSEPRDLVGLDLFTQQELNLQQPEVIDCQLTEKDQHSMVMLLSTTMQGPVALNAFFTMLRKLPTGELEHNHKVLLLEDPGFLKSAFWNSDDPNFGQEQGMNYQKMKRRAGLRISAEKVEEWTRGFEGMDGGWTSDNALDQTLSSIFDHNAFSYVSVFDLCASEAQAQALFELQSQHIVPSVSMTIDQQNPCIEEFRQALDKVSIIFVNGGNPDLVGFVLRKFAPAIGQMISDKVRSGSLIYMGRSAGAMVASVNFAYTYEPMPMLEEALLKGDTSGLKLAGNCAIRPHYKNLLWNIPTRVLQQALGEVGVLTENGEGLACDQGHCMMVGTKSREGEDIFKGPSQHLPRILKAYEFAYKGYKPPRPDFVTSCRPLAPQCEDVQHLPNTSLVLLASSNLAESDAQEAFQSLLASAPRKGSEVLVLDDAALLSKSFWDSSDEDFARALNYIKAGLSTSPELVREATQGFTSMDVGWTECFGCEDGALPGFNVEDFTRVSVFDKCATEEQKEALFRVQSQGQLPEVSMTLENDECLDSLEEMLEKVSVLVMSSGNPDLLGYVYKVFAQRFTAKITKRVREGSLIFVGLGAGAMFGGENFALTTAPSPMILELLHGNMKGLQLTGRCAVRPGWNNDDRLWDMTSSLYANAVGNMDIIGLQNGDVLACLRGRCAVRGRTKKRGATTLDCDQPSVHRGRINNEMARAFSKRFQ